jgi:cysteine desulfurase
MWVAPCSTATQADRKLCMDDDGRMRPATRSYLDYNASAPVRPEVAEAVARALDLPGNPSSVHAEGRAARAALERARAQVAALVEADPARVLFTSGGTEAVAVVLTPGLRRVGGEGAGRLLVGAAEHPCVLEGHRFKASRTERVAIAGDGRLCLSDLCRRLDAGEGETVLLSLQTANNETGVLQPLGKAAALVRERGGLVHTDAVQAVGKLAVRLADLGADALTLSAHKLGGPKGVGAVVLASDRIEIADRLLRGGGQERGQRAGTENLAGIVGFGVAAEVAARDLAFDAARLAALRDEAEAELLRIAPDAVIFGRTVERLPNTLAFAVPGLKAETALILFDLNGVSVSSGSACSSGKVRRSHVLDAMGVEPSLAAGAIRVSFGWNSGREDVFRFAQTCETVLAALYERKATAA